MRFRPGDIFRAPRSHGWAGDDPAGGQKCPGAVLVSECCGYSRYGSHQGCRRSSGHGCML